MLLTAAVVLGHPGGAARSPIAGQRVDLTLAAGEVHVAYVAEIPSGAGVPIGPIREAIGMTWDGEPLTLAWSGAEAVGPGDHGFTRIALSASAPLAETTGELRLRNDAFPDLPAFFYTSVEVPGDLVVEASNLARVVDGRLRGDQHALWRQADGVRDTYVRLRPAGFWEAADGPAPLPERMAGLPALGPPRWLSVSGAAAGVTALVLAWRWRASYRAGVHAPGAV